MTHVAALTLSVAGKLDALADPGLMPQAVIAPPLPDAVVGDAFIGVPMLLTVPAVPT
jgi:hypothetical protein